VSDIRFDYTCPKCGYHTGSDSPDLETCPIPVYGDGEPVILMPNDRRTYEDFPKCGGDIGEVGPMVPWWMLPNDIQLAIRDLARPHQNGENQ
jgi:hypothetical protein